MKAKIIKILSNQYTLVTHDNQKVQAVAMGKLRKADKPLVGDEVEYDMLDGVYAIQKVLPRENYLIRPAIANIDQALIVMSAVDPDFSGVLVDRLIFLISYANIEPVIVITKMDLAGPDHFVHKYIEDYRKSGYTVVLSDKNGDTSALQAVLKDKVSVLTGQSGVGKSSILNRINPDFSLNTQAISKALGRGKHTTRHVELYEVAQGWVADTPGFSSLDFSRIDVLTLQGKIKDFDIEGSCRFKDCRHVNEPDCKVKNAVKNGIVSAYRYQNYLDIIPECNKIKEWEKK